MSLRLKMILVLSCAILVIIAVESGIHTVIVFPSFVGLEQNLAIKDIHRCEEAINREVAHLNGLCADWAFWDDTYQFMADTNPDYIASNLVIETQLQNRLSYLGFKDPQNKIIWQRWLDLRTGAEIDPSENPAIRLEPMADPEDNISGVIASELGPMLIAANPVLDSNIQGPARGTLVMIRLLDDTYLAELKKQTNVEFNITSLPAPPYPAELKTILDHLPTHQSVYIHDNGSEALSVYAGLYDIDHKPIGLIRANEPRTITQYGRTALRYSMISVLLAGVFILALLSFTLQRIIVRPISGLMAHAADIRTSNDLSKRIAMSREDEIGGLSREIDHMVQELESASQSMEERIARRTAEIEIANQRLQTEIQQRVKTENALKFSEEKYRGIIENIPIGIFQSSREGRFMTVNQALANILGYDSPRELMNLMTDLRTQFYVYPQTRDQFIHRIEDQGSVKNFECRVYKKNKSIVYVSITAHTVRDGKGKTLYYEGILEDITKRKEAELLRTAKDAAEASNLIRSRFLISLGRQVRQPAESIASYIELMLASESSPQQQERLKNIGASCSRINAIAGDVMDYANIESGAFEVKKVLFKLDSLTESVSEKLSGLAAAKGQELILPITDDVPNALIGDPLLLEQVLLNLTGYAIQRSKEGDILLQIVLKEKSFHEARLKFSISYTGPGYSDEVLLKLFDPFPDTQESVMGRQFDTGLSLTISKNLIEMMNGELWFESDNERRHAFCFALALERPPMEDKDRQILPETLINARILVVDDNEVNQILLKKILTSFGLEAYSAASGQSAMDMLRIGFSDDKPYSLILLDWRMPEMSGLELSRRLKADSRFKQIPIIMITAFDQEETAQEVLEMGVEGYLIKPIQKNLLFDVIVKVLIADRHKADKPFLTKAYLQKEQLAGTRLLLVEDNLINLQIAHDILSNIGMRVDTANNGIEAYQAVNRTAYDFVLMDIQMPKMDGLEATRLIRKDEQHANLPIIAMTADSLETDREKCLKAGMNDYLPKPLNPEQILTTLHRWYKRIGEAGPTLPTPIADAIDLGQDTMINMHLPGIDIPSVLKRLGGKPQTLDNLLQIFVKEHASAAAKIRLALNQAQYETAKQIVHTIKGISKNLSARALHKAALELEIALNTETFKDIDALLTIFERALDQVKTASADFTRALAKPAADEVNALTQADDFLRPEKEARMLELARLIRKHNVRSVHSLEKLRPLFTDDDSQRCFAEIREQLGSFNFKKAYAIIEEMLTRFSLAPVQDENAEVHARQQFILVVDDAITNISTLISLLPDYEILAATSGADALDIAFSSDPPDLILLDVVMPNINGYEVCRILKENESTKNVPIIFITIKNEDFEEVKGFSLGAADYITRPFSPGRVKTRVEMQLKLKQHNERLEELIQDRTEALRESERRYRQLFENAGDGIFQCYPDGHMMRANSAMARILGYQSSEELISSVKNILKQCYASSADRRKFADQLLEKGQVVGFEGQGIRKDGTMFWSSVSARAVFDTKGDVQFYEGFLVDITERIEKEKAVIKRELAEATNKKILESIRYAKMIQGSLLPDIALLKTYLPKSFSIWMPRDIIGGDIIFADAVGDNFIVAVIDCTGHGVPGAFMTMIASIALKQIVRDYGFDNPSGILKQLNMEVKKTLQQDTQYAPSDDGLDAGICLINTAHNALVFAGAKLPLFYHDGQSVHKIKGDRENIGYKRSDINFNFTNHTIPITPGTAFYLATDGYTDQVGGEHARMLGSRRLKALIAENHSLSFDRQKKNFQHLFENFARGYEQRDDVTLVGFGF